MSPPGRPRRRGRLALVLAVGTLGGIAAGYALTRASGPPGAPGAITAEPSRCPDPCKRPLASVTIGWQAPSAGVEPSGYRVFRDGDPIPETQGLGAGTTSFVDRDVTFGQRYGYQVVSLSSRGSSPRSATSWVRVPTPPAASAQLAGAYAVRLTVRRAHAISSMLRIEGPKPGDTAMDRWTFQPLCSPPRTGCAAGWEGLDGRLVRHGRSWTGTVAGPDARCGAGTTVEAPTRFDLTATGAEPDGDAWVVREFEGTVGVSFHCPGFLASRGSVAVTGTRG